MSAPETKNPEWGFWGSLEAGGMEAERQALWERAVAALVQAEGWTPEQARDVLDSRIGCHLADQLVGHKSPHYRLTELLLVPGWRADIQATFRELAR